MSITKFTVAAALAFSATAVGATSLIDGGFEAKGAATPVTDYCYDGFSTPGGPACAASAWTGGGVIKSGSGPWGGTTTPYGSYYGFIQGAQVTTQSFTATSTGTLTLTWFDSNRSNIGGAHSYAVSVSDGVTTTALGTFTGAVGGFVAKSASPFVGVAGTTYTVSFAGISNGSDSTAFIDHVTLTVVPEPGTWVLMLAGLGVTGVGMRRRRVSAVTA